MKYLPVFFEVLTAYLTGQGTFTIGGASGVVVTVTLATGTPVHLTFAAAMLAVEKIVAGIPGNFQSGEIVVTITAATPTSS